MILRGLVPLCPLLLLTIQAFFRPDVRVEGRVLRGLVLSGPHLLS